MQLSITNYGGIITSIKAPDRQGNVEEISAGFPDLNSYLRPHPYFGTIVGRFANRIARGRFNIGEEQYQLSINNGVNHLHGGENGFHTRLWNYHHELFPHSACLTLSHISPHLEEGYPGTLKTMIMYTISDSNTLDILYHAQTDRETHVNLTSHCYFNLSGFKDDVFSHQLTLNADHYLQLDETQIPTGKMLACAGTSFDYRPGNPARCISQPMDHCFVMNPATQLQQPSAELYHKNSGRKITMFCTQPGIQVYTSNFLDGSLQGHRGTFYQKHHAVCLESQHFPDSPNQKSFPSTLLKPGESYRHTSRFHFGVE